MKKVDIIISAFVFASVLTNAQEYSADWRSINSRPIPEWFVDAKFGIFVHWGVYSVPSYRPVSEKMYETYAEWYEASVMNPGNPGYGFHVNNFGDDFAYRDFAPLFKAELYDPEYWADLFAQSGAKYVVLTSKHHDGYCLWPAKSPYSKNWNSVDVGPERDLLGELTNAVRQKGMRMGIYYSLMEWETTPRNHEWSGGTTGYYLPEEIIRKYAIPEDKYVDDHMMNHLKDLVINYQPALIFADGEWDRSYEYWKSLEFLAWLYNQAPNKDEVVVNDRWGMETRGKHGGYFTSEYASHQDEMTKDHPWEESRGMGQSYGYNRAENIEDYNTSEQLIHELIEIVSHGGNLLLNVGPTADGRIPVIMQQRLVDIGNWLDINGEAIYDSKPWKIQFIEHEDHDVYFTTKAENIYVITTSIPENGVKINGTSLSGEMDIQLLGNMNIEVVKEDKENESYLRLSLNTPFISCQPAYVFRLKPIGD